MNLRPLHDWVVIRPSTAEEKTAGGLFIPDTAKEKPHEGMVEAVGPGAYAEEKGKKKGEKKERRFVPSIVRAGDRVLYEQYAGQTYKIGEEELVLVRERDILGTLPESQSRTLQLPAATTTAGATAIVPHGSGDRGPAAKAEKSPASTAKKTATKKTGKKK